MNETQKEEKMSIITVKDQFDIWSKQSQDFFDKLEEDITAITEPIQTSLKNNSISNIPHDFGKFLYSCLGERVTGQANSVINTEWLKTDNGKAIIDAAKEKKCTVEEYLRQHDYHSDYRSNKVFNQTQAFLTAGRKFGVTYVTGGGDRTHTMYFGEGAIFKYFTQEHVDCVRNKAKRVCCQEFLDYKNEFVFAYKQLNNDDNIIEVGLPIEIAKITQLTTGAKYANKNSRTSERNMSAIVIEQYEKDVVESATIAMNDIDVWDKQANVNVSRHTVHNLIPAFTLQFGSVKGNKRANGNSKPTVTYCNVDIGINDIKTSLDSLDQYTDSPICNANDTRQESMMFHNIINKLDNNERYYARQDMNTGCGIVVNMVDLIKHPNVQGAIQKRLDFFKSWSEKLQELKHKNASLYFLNSD